MTRTNVPTSSPVEGQIGFSRAVRVGNIISVSGTAPIAPDGTTAFPGDVYGQARFCLEIIKKAVEQAGGGIEHVTRTRIMLREISGWKEAARAHREFFSAIKPACTFVEVKGFVREDWLVEIEADCVIPGD